MTYKESMNYLKASRRFGSRPGLERISELCRGLGDPQKGLRYIHVTGTNGKGSVCAMVSSVLKFAGMKVGLFTSPYMLDFSERFVADGRRITRDEISSIVTEVAAVADTMEDTPTEFELLTAMSFLFFRRRGCNIIVYEAGMGGRLDSTNVIPAPEVAVITGVALDHTEVLGKTITDIAAEKAGIIKRGCTVVAGDMPEEALDVISRKAKAEGCTLVTTGSDTPYEVIEKRFSEGGASLTFKDGRSFDLPLAGLYQFKNTATAVAVLDSLDIWGKKLPDIVIGRGLRDVRWRGRFEMFSPDPVLIFDGGHNPEGVRAVADSLAVYYPGRKFAVVTGVMGDKDHLEMAQTMAEFAACAYTVAPDNPRAMDAEAYAEELRQVGIDATPCEDMVDALTRASGKDVIVLGSLYMYKQFIEALEI